MDVIKETDEIVHMQTEYEQRKRTFMMQLRSQLVAQIDAAYAKHITGLEVAENLILASIPVDILQAPASQLRQSGFDIIALMAALDLQAGGAQQSDKDTKKGIKASSQRKAKKVAASAKKEHSPAPNRHMTPTKSSPTFESKAKSQGRHTSKQKNGIQGWRM